MRIYVFILDKKKTENEKYVGILLPPTCKTVYVNMQHNMNRTKHIYLAC